MLRLALAGLFLAGLPQELPLASKQPFASAKISYRTPGGEGVAWIQGARASFRRREKRGTAPAEEHWAATDGREVLALHRVGDRLELASRRPHAGRDLAELLAGWDDAKRAPAMARIPAVWRRYSPVFGHDYLGTPVDFLGGRTDKCAGRDCEVYRYSTNSNWTAWFWKGGDVVLKLEDAGVVVFEAVKVELDLPVPPGAFEAPEGVEFKEDGELGRRGKDAVEQFLGKPAAGSALATVDGKAYALTELVATLDAREDGDFLSIETEDCPWHFKLRLKLPAALDRCAGKSFARPCTPGEDGASLAAWDDLAYEARELAVKVEKVEEDSLVIVVGGTWERIQGAGRKAERAKAAWAPLRIQVPRSR